MTRFKKIFIFMFCMLLFSCDNDRQQIVIKTFPESGWHRFDKLSFDLQVKNTGMDYSIMAVTRHSLDFAPDRIPLHIILTLPSGEERIWEQTIQIRNPDGSFIGILKDDVVELEFPLRSQISFREKGKINLLIEQIIPKYDTPGILSFGLKMVVHNYQK